MSRYYKIKLTDKNNQPIKFDSFSGGFASSLQAGTFEPGVITSLLPDKSTNPGALNIELDITQMPGHVGNSQSYVRIYGLSLKDVFSLDLSQANIEVSVGMAQGLPLATAAQKQAGLVIKGSVFQAFGNWLGTDMTLDLIIGAGGLTGTHDQPKNYKFDWHRGQTLEDAIRETLSNSPLSGINPKIKINDDRTGPADNLSGTYDTLEDFGKFIREHTEGVHGENDKGVYIYNIGSDVIVGDTSIKEQTGPTTQIAFQDLLGQVTWFAPNEMTCKLVMRGDLQVGPGSFVRFPQNPLKQTQAGALPSFFNRTRDTVGIASDQQFWISRIHHWGNYRQPDAMSWNTTLGLVQNVGQ
jgi:hypothetical protein